MKINKVKIYQHFNENDEVTTYCLHLEDEGSGEEIVFECIEKQIADDIQGFIIRLLVDKK